MENLELSNGTFIYGRRHLVCHADVIPLLPEACEKLGEVADAKFVRTIDMGRVIGKSTVVPTTANDETYYARRAKRHGLSRFVIGKPAVPCDKVTLVVRKEVAYGKPVLRIVTAYIGVQAPREPEDTTMTDEERKDSIEFWNNHAFVEENLSNS